jgi:hypothetical protein
MSPSDDGPEGLPWDPKSEIDPIKLQAEAVEVMRELLAEQRKAKAARNADLENLSPPVLLGPVYTPPKPPTFEELSARLKKAWYETARIAPSAPPAVQLEIWRSLVANQSDGISPYPTAF